MSGDSYREVESQGWLSRLGGAVTGVLFGVILFGLSFVVLFWNEGRAVRTARSLAEGASAVVPVGAEKVDPAREGKLVQVSGLATTGQTLKDPTFAVPATALRLQRIVKMYQWQEKEQTESRKKFGGGEERIKTYTYSRAWSDRPIDSGRFKKPEDHRNPAEWPLRGWSATAQEVTLGAFRLPPDLVAQIRSATPLPVGAAGLEGVPADLKDRAKVSGDHYYFGDDPASPQVGDLTVEFTEVKPTTVSLLSQQAGDSFRPYQTRSGDALNRLQVGSATAPEMFRAAEAENNRLTWILRLVGFIAMAAGIYLALRPLVVLADVVPLFGNILSYGTGLLAGGVALVLSLATIALGWIAYRPVVGISLLAVALGTLIGMILLGRGRRKSTQETAAATWS